MAKKRVVIKGEKVQDVGYRLFLLEAAESIGLKGFQARNVGNDVEFLVEGDENKVADFVGFAKTNYPELAEVKEVVTEDYDGNIMSIEGFYRSFSAGQLVKIVNVGVNMVGKQDLMLQKQDTMLGKMDEMIQRQDLMLQKQDTMLGKQDTMLGKMDMMLQKQDVLIGEVRGLRGDLKTYMDERFRRIEAEIASIKEKIGIA
ncbi:MAG: acylphosphatase [Candidatus Brockarchaeota archaeon]|nr:acylphosphatase [Candidatus Brockarchaeota archaeon]